MIIITDVDGVLTDGTIYIDSKGTETKRFNVRDGHAVEIAKKHGIRIIFLTKSRAECIKKRADFLGVECFVSDDKAHSIVYEIFPTYLDERVKFHYIGDDVIDIDAMLLAKQRACPADAHPKVIDIMLSTDIVLKSKGGKGCLREYVDYLIQEHNLKPC